MRIFTISDLHAGVSPKGDSVLRGLAAHIVAEGRSHDVLLVGGDIAIDDAGIAECLGLFRDFRGQKAAVAGNHDIWIDGGAHVDSMSRHRKVQDIFRTSSFVPLEEEPLIVGGVGFVGAMGWYDGSFIDESLGISQQAYATKTPPWSDRPIWNDAVYAKWNATDQSVTDWQLNKLSDRLIEVANLREVVALIHHVPSKQLLPYPNARWMVPKVWRFANAFLGSERISELLSRFPNVRTVVNGHVHFVGEAKIGQTSYFSIGGDYDSKQLLLIEGGRAVRRSFSA